MADTEQAAAAFCEAQYDRLVGGLALYLGDLAVAEEVAQEALLRTFARWERVRRLEFPAGWTWRVAMNLATSALRRRTAQRRAYGRLAAGMPLPEAADHDPTPSLAVRDALLRLPHRQRAVVVLRYYLDLSVADTADRMGTTPDAVRSLTKRAVAALRDDLRHLAVVDDDALPREGH